MHTPGGALTVVMCMTLRVNMLDAGCWVDDAIFVVLVVRACVYPGRDGGVACARPQCKRWTVSVREPRRSSRASAHHGALGPPRSRSRI